MKLTKEDVEKIVDKYLDENINASHPYEERCNGDVVIFSKYDYGRQVVLENWGVGIDLNDFDDDNEYIEYDELSKVIDKYIEVDIKNEILKNAVDYCLNNDIKIK